MTIVNMHEAKTHLSRLVERALAGEEVVVAKSGKPLVRLVPVEEKTGKRKLGQWEGKVSLPDDWDSDEVNEAIAREFEESRDPFLDPPEK
jgi:prevent-host-death family protein